MFCAPKVRERRMIRRLHRRMPVPSKKRLEGSPVTALTVPLSVTGREPRLAEDVVKLPKATERFPKITGPSAAIDRMSWLGVTFRPAENVSI